MESKEAIDILKENKRQAEVILQNPTVFYSEKSIVGGCETMKKNIEAYQMAIDSVCELQKAKETIRKLMCSEYGSSCQFCIHDKNNDAMCCNVGGSGSWCCENAAWNGKDS